MSYGMKAVQIDHHHERIPRVYMRCARLSKGLWVTALQYTNSTGRRITLHRYTQYSNQYCNLYAARCCTQTTMRKSRSPRFLASGRSRCTYDPPLRDPACVKGRCPRVRYCVRPDTRTRARATTYRAQVAVCHKGIRPPVATGTATPGAFTLPTHTRHPPHRHRERPPAARGTASSYHNATAGRACMSM